MILGGWVFLMSEVPLYSLEQVSGLPAHLTESVYEVVFQKSIPAQIRQIVLFGNNEG